jgi:uncharacterized membrane protein YbjE (DUF340 family)
LKGEKDMGRKVIEVIASIILGYFTGMIVRSDGAIITGSIFWILVFILFHIPDRKL